MDAGEVGAGHSVTALYELKLREEAHGPVATVFVRYEDPDRYEIVEISQDFYREDLWLEFEDASPRFQLAAVVAEYAEILRDSYWAQESDLEDVLAKARQVRRMLSGDPDVKEFVDLVSVAEGIKLYPDPTPEPLPDDRR